MRPLKEIVPQFGAITSTVPEQNEQKENLPEENTNVGDSIESVEQSASVESEKDTEHIEHIENIEQIEQIEHIENVEPEKQKATGESAERTDVETANGNDNIGEEEIIESPSVQESVSSVAEIVEGLENTVATAEHATYAKPSVEIGADKETVVIYHENHEENEKKGDGEN